MISESKCLALKHALLRQRGQERARTTLSHLVAYHCSDANKDPCSEGRRSVIIGGTLVLSSSMQGRPYMLGLQDYPTCLKRGNQGIITVSWDENGTLPFVRRLQIGDHEFKLYIKCSVTLSEMLKSLPTAAQFSILAAGRLFETNDL